MNEVETKQRLKDERDVAVPTSHAPSMESLQQKVSQVRRRRTMLRSVTGAAAVLMCVVGSIAMLNRSNDQSNDVAMPQNNHVAVAIDPTPAAVESTDQTPVDQKLVASEPKIQLYARVRGAVPVFDIDAEKKLIQHVGWAESERKVPVDMRYVPESHQETFHAVLSSNNQDDWHLSL